MEIEMTNKLEIAGVPALALRQFFADWDEPFRVVNLVHQLNLNDSNTVSVLDRLISDGYLQVEEGEGLIKTPKAKLLTRRTTLAPLTREEGYNVILSVLKRAGEINCRAETAHRITGAKVIGTFLTDSTDDIQFVEMEICIWPIADDNEGIQSGIEELAAEYAYNHGETRQLDGNNRQRSIDFIRNLLLFVYPHAVLRFTIE